MRQVASRAPVITTRAAFVRAIQVRGHAVLVGVGLATMVGWVLADNPNMLEMVSHLGFQVARDAEDPRNRRVTLAL